MDIKILVATHKKYRMPTDKCYIPIHVGSAGKESIGYIGDNSGVNISNKNPYYCELTGLYWGVKNLDCDYMGLVHYRRYFTKSKITLFNNIDDKFQKILSDEEVALLLEDNDIILPKKRNYYIETLYTHYAHTHYAEHLDETRKIIEENFNDYLDSFDLVMKRKSAHMFNMFIMKKTLAEEYCTWLFNILGELEERIDYTSYDAFQARLFGRVSELLLDVWIEKNNLKFKEVPYMHIEKINWLDKGFKFLKAKFKNEKFEKSF